MKLQSTYNPRKIYDFKEAVILGTPLEGGLFVPVSFPVMEKSFYDDFSSLSFKEISFCIADKIIGDEFEKSTLLSIIEKAFDFDLVLKPLYDGFNILELYHGPTLAFKDFGARFMAGILSNISKENNKETIVLAATSGDTGSAVASSLHNKEGIKVVLLYPSEKVSPIQETQLTTFGGNVVALEIKGSFDDCQRMVKEAFADNTIRVKLNLTSANSINIARLIPQSFYYHYAKSRLTGNKNKVVFSVPTGNMGNLTGGLFALKMGLEFDQIIAAVNSNKVISNYIKTGIFKAEKSIKTFSNAMDVGNPSNLERVLSLYNFEHKEIQKIIFSESFNDEQTLECMEELYSSYNYIADPHTVVGFLAARHHKTFHLKDMADYVILSTAHPSKFSDIIEKTTIPTPEAPLRLKSCLDKEKKSILLNPDYEKLKELLLSL